VVELAACGPPALEPALEVPRVGPAFAQSLRDAAADLAAVGAIHDDAARSWKLARPFGDALRVAPQRSPHHLAGALKCRVRAHVDYERWPFAAKRRLEFFA
jgi:hypothetical protein